jgi:hypothetical protein
MHVEPVLVTVQCLEILPQVGNPVDVLVKLTTSGLHPTIAEVVNEGTGGA